MEVHVKVSAEKFSSVQAQMYVMFVQEGFNAEKVCKDFASKTTFSFKDYFAEMEFTGKVKSVVTFPVQLDNRVVHFSFVCHQIQLAHQNAGAFL